MKRPSLLVLAALAIVTAAASWAFGADAPPVLVPQTPILDPRSPGSFDYLEVDEKYRRVLVAHTGSRSLDVIDVNNDSLLRQEALGAEPHGIAVDVKDGKYFVGVSRQAYVMVVGRKFMVKDDQIPTGGPIDAVALDPKTSMLYADRFDNNTVVVINAKTNKVYYSIPINGTLEYIIYDPVSDRIYQNVASTGQVAVIDPNANKVVTSWSAAPATDLRGLVVDGASHRLFVAGDNGKLAVLDTTTGGLVTSLDIPPSVDQIAFDAGNKRVYCASSLGLLSVVQETAAGADHLADVTVPRRTHSVTVDPRTHAVWIAYAAEDDDYVMKLVPSP